MPKVSIVGEYHKKHPLKNAFFRGCVQFLPFTAGFAARYSKTHKKTTSPFYRH